MKVFCAATLATPRKIKTLPILTLFARSIEYSVCSDKTAPVRFTDVISDLDWDRLVFVALY